MSIWTSLYTGSSGLGAHGDAINVIGDNIANVSTTGYKESRAGFADVLGDSSAINSAGDGVHMTGAEVSFGQGSLQQTGRPLDMAITGEGFFAVSGSHNGTTGTFFTRDGRFQLDNTNTVVNSNGLKLQGYMIDGAGTTATSATDLQIGGQSPPHATTTVKMAVNLDATTKINAGFNPASPTTTSDYHTSETVYDSLGTSHTVDLFYRNAGGGSWEWHAMVDGGQLTGGQSGVPTEIANGTLGFTADGKLNTDVTLASSASFVNATPNQAITFNNGDPLSVAGNTGIAGTTQFAGISTVKATNQDGFASGTLSNVSIAADGTISGQYSNGQSRALARVSLATFTSQQGLIRAGDQLFNSTPASGEPLVAAAGTGARGGISGGSTEGSNVDLSNELVMLIAYQRAFSANSKTVQTADEMLQEISSLKR